MILIRRLCACAALILASPLALADVAQPFLGKWSVEWHSSKRTYQAVMVITETGGTWQTATQDRNNPCAGREVPLQHDSASADSLNLTLKFSDVMTGCGNVSVKLRLDDKGQVVGKRSEFDLKLERK